jgi:murein L,D-transpeptidase YafK
MPAIGRCAYNPGQGAGVDRNVMNFRSLGALALLLGLVSGVAGADGLPQAQPVMLPQPALGTLPLVDRVVVHKAERRLLLMHGGNIVRSYHVALGLSPIGQKERSGDFRTPEGTYRLERRNARSDYFLSIKVSYPNESDLKRARSRHWDTGGSIMIHGLPNYLRHEPEFYLSHDWTDGCIAVSNADMTEIWMLTPDDVPIDILP